MKQTLRLRGELCPKTKLYTKILYTIYITFTVVLVSCVCTRAQVSASAQEAGPAAEAVSEIKPLKIGDTIPEALWNMPLQVVKAGQEGTSTVTLDDYKGKLIILDFWATWCGSCIAAFPDAMDIGTMYKDDLVIIPVTSEKNEKVISFINTNKVVKELDISSIVNDTFLKGVFSHKLLPHLVWIGKNGLITDFSLPLRLNRTNVERSLQGKYNEGGAKIDMDVNKPLYATSQLPEESTMVYNVFVRGYQQGLPMGNIKRRVKGQICGLAMYNLTIADMYWRLYRLAGRNFTKEQITLLGADADNLWYSDIRFEDEKWRKHNLYTLEFNLPGIPDDCLYQKMIEQLNTYSGYRATVSGDNLIIIYQQPIRK